MTFAVARRRHRPLRSSANGAETWLRFWTGAGSINPRRGGFSLQGERPSSGAVCRAGRRAGRRAGFCRRGRGGGVYKLRGRVSTDTAPLPAGFARAFGARPDGPSRASGEGLYGSDPPFLTAGAVSRGGGCLHRCLHQCLQSPPPLRGGRSRRIYPCGKAPTTACGRDGDERRARPTDEQTSSGCRPVLSEIVRNFRP